jgi:hypothetical protein
MKRIALLVAVLGLLSEISGQEALKVPEGKEIWLNSAPGALDMAGMFTRSDEERYAWNELRQHVSVVHYYQGHTMLYPSQNFVDNSYTYLKSQGYWKGLREMGLDESIEVGAVKWFACNWEKNELDQMVHLATESVSLVNEAGGVVKYLTIDSSIPGGYECRSATLNTRDIAQIVADWMKDVRRNLADRGLNKTPIQIGDIEPYPYVDIATHKWYVDMVMSESAKLRIPGLSHYILDVDYYALRDYEKLAQDVRDLCDHVRRKGVRCGIILNGKDTDTSLDYADSVEKRLVLFKSLGLFEMVDIISIQSWAMTSSGKQNLPDNVPETQPFTQTNLALHILRCAFNFPGWDCTKYPQPR